MEQNNKKEEQEILNQNWIKVFNDWGVDQYHEEFIQSCLYFKRLDFAVLKYSKKKDDEIAKKKINQLIFMMEIELKNEFYKERPDRKKFNFISWFLFFLVTGILLGMLFQKVFS